MTTPKATHKTASAPRPLSEAEFIHYTPEEVEEKKLLPFKASTLRAKCYAREIPHNNGGGRITFSLRHIKAISEIYDVPAVADKNRTPAA